MNNEHVKEDVCEWECSTRTQLSQLVVQGGEKVGRGGENSSLLPNLNISHTCTTAGSL